MCSSILWMLALGGPNSITWGQMRAMKRPSEVPPVVVADGFGDPATKAGVYTSLLGLRNSAGIKYRGLKLFYLNPYEQAGHLDDPLLTWAQVFGRAPTYDGAQRFTVWPPPNVVVIA